MTNSTLHPRDLVAPIFVRQGKNIRNPIASMPGVFQLSPDMALEELRRLEDLGIAGFILFGVTDKDKKDPLGSHAHDPDNAVCQTLRAYRDSNLPHKLQAITDLCYCEYTSHGHCGMLTPENSIDHAKTVSRLGVQAVNHANAGASVIAPSGKMNHAVAAIRAALNAADKKQTTILSYAVKYASSFYGPFRDAAESPPQFGDRKSHQMDFLQGEAAAVAAAKQDVSEGADMVMVKPGVPYLDILRAVKNAVTVPTAIYHVSGEYAMLKAAAANKWIDEEPVVLETMHAFKRAGASLILTYYAADVAGWIK